MDTVNIYTSQISGKIILIQDSLDIKSDFIKVLSNQDEITDLLNKINSPDYWLLLIGAIIGAVFGFCFALMWEYRKARKKNKKYAELYERYVGLYLVYPKDNKDDIRFCFDVKRDGKTLIIENGISVMGNRDVYSKISLVDDIPNYGYGYYRHDEEKSGITRYGFLKIQLDGDKILSHVIVFENGKQCSDSYIWNKQDPNQKEEIIKKYRQIQEKRLKKLNR